MRILFVLLAMVLAPIPALAQTADSVQINAYGIYTAQVQTASRDASGVLNSTSTGIHLVTQTTTVPARLGARFGIEFTLSGAPAGLTTLRKVVTFPAGIVYPPSTTPIYSSDGAISVANGTVTYTGWKFDDPWELVPGVWTIQIWDGDRKLAEQQFNVVAAN
jgi:hypothetical protein